MIKKKVKKRTKSARKSTKSLQIKKLKAPKLESFKIETMKLDPLQKLQFEEFLDYMLKVKKPFSFENFNRITGISRLQWDIFRIENKDKDVEWVVVE